MSLFNANGKRSRNDNDDAELVLPEQKHRCHSDPNVASSTTVDNQSLFGAALPFRLSPTIKHTRLFSQTKRNAPHPLFTQTITPTDSDEEMSPGCAFTRVTFPNVQDKAYMSEVDNRQNTTDIDMALASPQRRYTPRDLDMDSMMLSPQASPFTKVSFDNLRPGSPANASSGRIPTPIYGHFQSPLESNASTSPELSAPLPTFDNEYETHMRARRLPTPISEDEAMDTFEDSEEMLRGRSGSQLRQPARFPPPMLAQPSKRNKPVFSMGFRADCDMCKNRVPGHYNHILWT